MAGLYLHIPFCRKACHYCNFHFSTSMKLKRDLVDAMIVELELQKEYLETKVLDTIYFGGGTPSILTADELNKIFDKIYELYTVNSGAEITLEANPDDLSIEKLKELKKTPINRLSIGVQSFFDEHLTWMNRSHLKDQAISCIKNAQAIGFNNLTVDLIYGLPDLTHEQWAENIQVLLDFKIQHISCYCLTVEDGTALGHFVKKGLSKPVDEEKASVQFEYLIDTLSKNGFAHYEISNFGKQDFLAKHNTSYWKGASYLGIGPGAHSYNGHSERQWNIANNSKYIKAINQKDVPFEKEILTIEEQYNEFVMISLRTQWGLNEQLLSKFGTKCEQYFLKNIQPFITEKDVIIENNVYKLTLKGKLLADKIAMELFVD